ncbi:helix-turn-helix domain-containing protein [Thalassobaculum sp. OXR-137]|uniref:helix-turn-helix domain-containing protein n=1 Tax=Thalassobaculum sp. OXR-137 TaxID=3100173 RepID=UPI002AC9DBD8|nr:helix-turn-helix domain-containing protein [Thalassobaculum sp. OXR-137]WPZ33139.1 helix-turn-helix domain-containing protein [Thalassobaculum sp. OXR-137]
MNVSGRQIAAARVMAGLDQKTLAAAANVSVATLRRMEASDGNAAGLANNVAAVIRAIEEAGVELIPENGGGAGVRLRKGHDGPG